MASSASPAGAVNPLPSQTLGYYDSLGNTGTVAFDATAMSVTITSAMLPVSPLVFTVTASGNDYSGVNSTATLTLKVETGSLLCYGVLTYSSGSVVSFGAKQCSFPGGWLLLMSGGQEVGTVLITSTQVTVQTNGNPLPPPQTYAVTCTVGAAITIIGQVTGSLATPTTGQITISGTGYTIAPGLMLPSPGRACNRNEVEFRSEWKSVWKHVG